VFYYILSTGDKMKINSVDLVISAVRRSQYPDDNKPEFLLVGRSNVGKSSFINTLINRKSYAKTSKIPGRTQTLNFYLVNNGFYLVDVPGYGYAAVNKKKQRKFGLMIEEYLEKRKQLKHVFMIIDFRHKPSEDDLLMYHFLKYFELPVTVIATKADKVGTSLHFKQRKLILDTLDLVLGDELILFSNVTKLGRLEVLDKIERVI
jgi:GTP-binding protein